MKKLMSLMVGLSLALGAVSMAFAQDEKKADEKKAAKKKAGKKKKTETEKKGA